MLYRHVQPLFVSTEYHSNPVSGPRMRVRPLDSDAPDHLLRFVFWGAIQVRTATRAADPKPDPSLKAPEVVVVTGSARPKLLIEMSPDGEGWVVQSTLESRERPYLVTIARMLSFIRARLDTGGAEVRGYALVMANAPFALEGGSPLIGAGQPVGGPR